MFFTEGRDADLAQMPMARAHASAVGTTAVLWTPPQPDLGAIALFLDVDGTLLDFAPHPDAVSVAADVPDLLRALQRRLDGALALISGRPLHDIDRLFGIAPLAAAGLHGAELRGADDMVIAAAQESAPMAALRRRAETMLSALPGTFVEAKPNALALHYRTAPANAAAVRKAAAVLAQAAGPAYALQPGNHVIELKPAAADKGSAVARLMQERPFVGRLPWVLGDDLTDEHAFATADALGGTGVVVGARRPTGARHALADPAATRAWLARLVRTPAVREPRA